MNTSESSALQELTFDLPQFAIRRFRRKTTTRTCGLQLVFNFTCKFLVEGVWYRSAYSANQLINQIDLEVTVVMTRKQFSEATEIITDKLRHWDLESHCLDALVSVAVDNAAEAIRLLMADFSREVVIDVPVTVVETHFMDEMPENVPEMMPGMVPAAESAIEESLREVAMMRDEAQMCTVCLEEIQVDCKATTTAAAVTMPCSHSFHGECIRRWLRTSHYCPVCRFDLPTTPDTQ